MSDRHHPSQQRDVWPPSPGFFLLRLVRGGWRVPCRIVKYDDGLWRAIIDGEAKAPHSDPSYAEGVADVWHYGEITDASDYHWREAIREDARAHDPRHPSLHPRQPISAMRLTPIIPPKRTL